MEDMIKHTVTYISYFAFFSAIVVISIGIIRAFLIYIKGIFMKNKSRTAIQESRLEIGHSFSLCLSFLIGASILKTTIAPTWTEIGQLASIVMIRTIMNYFLVRDVNKMEEVKKD